MCHILSLFGSCCFTYCLECTQRCRLPAAWGTFIGGGKVLRSFTVLALAHSQLTDMKWNMPSGRGLFIGFLILIHTFHSFDSDRLKLGVPTNEVRKRWSNDVSTYPKRTATKSSLAVSSFKAAFSSQPWSVVSQISGEKCLQEQQRQTHANTKCYKIR